MVKNRLVILLTVFLMTAHCMGMQMAAQQSEQGMKRMDESSAKELIQKILGRQYVDIVSEVNKLSDEQKECIKTALGDSHPLFTPRTRLQQNLSGHTSDVTSVVFSTDGQCALTGSCDYSARLWDLTKSPVTSQEIGSHNRIITSVALSNDRRFALTGSFDHTARLWDLTKSPVTCRELTGHTDLVESVAFSPDSRFALTGSYDKTARLWNLTESPITSQVLTRHNNVVESVCFSPDGQCALTGSWDDDARLLDLTKSPVTSRELTGHSYYVTSVAFSPDGRFALTGSLDKTARLWDLTKSPITSKKLTGHSDWVRSVAFSPNGRYILTGSADKTARLWDLTKSPPITVQVIKGHTSTVSSVAFSPDSRFALIGSNNLRLWQIESVNITPLTVEDALLLIKAYKSEYSLKDDSQALERLQSIIKEPQQQIAIVKLFANYLYRIELPEQECWICSEMYDSESRVCMQLSCCKKQICKACVDRLGTMSYSTEFEGYQFQHAVIAKCPFCNKPANQMGVVKKCEPAVNS